MALDCICEQCGKCKCRMHSSQTLPSCLACNGSAFAPLRAWWSTEPACLAQRHLLPLLNDDEGIPTWIILAPVHSHSAALGACVWGHICFYLAYFIYPATRDA